MVGWKWFCEELELLKSQKKQLQKESNEKVEMGNEFWIHIQGLPSQSLLCVSMGLRTRDSERGVEQEIEVVPGKAHFH